jgi:hypothetical protein
MHPFQFESCRDGRLLFPLVVTNPRNGRRIICDTLFDSGADRCYFSADLAKCIGIPCPSADLQLARLANGTYGHFFQGEVELTLPNGKGERFVVRSTVAFFENLATDVIAKAGRNGFLELFDTCISGSPQSVQLTPNARFFAVGGVYRNGWG